MLDVDQIKVCKKDVPSLMGALMDHPEGFFWFKLCTHGTEKVIKRNLQDEATLDEIKFLPNESKMLNQSNRQQQFLNAVPTENAKPFCRQTIDITQLTVNLLKPKGFGFQSCHLFL